MLHAVQSFQGLTRRRMAAASLRACGESHKRGHVGSDSTPKPKGHAYRATLAGKRIEALPPQRRPSTRHGDAHNEPSAKRRHPLNAGTAHAPNSARHGKCSTGHCTTTAFRTTAGIRISMGMRHAPCTSADGASRCHAGAEGADRSPDGTRGDENERRRRTTAGPKRGERRLSRRHACILYEIDGRCGYGGHVLARAFLRRLVAWPKTRQKSCAGAAARTTPTRARVRTPIDSSDPYDPSNIRRHF